MTVKTKTKCKSVVQVAKFLNDRHSLRYKLAVVYKGQHWVTNGKFLVLVEGEYADKLLKRLDGDGGLPVPKEVMKACLTFDGLRVTTGSKSMSLSSHGAMGEVCVNLAAADSSADLKGHQSYFDVEFIAWVKNIHPKALMYLSSYNDTPVLKFVVDQKVVALVACCAV